MTDTTMKPVHIINVPLDLGASRRGTDAGPSAFRIAGLSKAVTKLGYTLTAETDIPVPAMESRQTSNTKARFKDEILAVCENLATQSLQALEKWRVSIGYRWRSLDRDGHGGGRCRALWQFQSRFRLDLV